MERNPLEALKNIPYLNEDILREITSSMKWPDPNDILSGLSQRKWPPLDIVETPGEVIVTVAIPGLRQASDVRVELKGTTLTLEGEINFEPQLSRMVKVHQQEMHQGKFSRTITLPLAVNSKSARATYHQGILEIRFVKIQGGQTETLTINFS